MNFVKNDILQCEFLEKLVILPQCEHVSIIKLTIGILDTKLRFGTVCKVTQSLKNPTKVRAGNFVSLNTLKSQFQFRVSLAFLCKLREKACFVGSSLFK